MGLSNYRASSLDFLQKPRFWKPHPCCGHNHGIMKTTTFLLSLFLCFLCTEENKSCAACQTLLVLLPPCKLLLIAKAPSQRTVKLRSRFLTIITFSLSNVAISRWFSVTIWKYFQNLLLNKIYKVHKIPFQNPGIGLWKQACYRCLCFNFSDFTAHILTSLPCQPREASPASGAKGSKRHPGATELLPKQIVSLYLSFPAILSAIPGS